MVAFIIKGNKIVMNTSKILINTRMASHGMNGLKKENKSRGSGVRIQKDRMKAVF
jgi:hypothetical protein